MEDSVRGPLTITPREKSVSSSPLQRLVFEIQL